MRTGVVEVLALEDDARAAGVLGAVLALTACGGGSDPLAEGTEDSASGGSSESVIIGSANFPESELLAEIYAQALEERNHALMMVQYLLDTDTAVKLPGVDAPVSDFADVVAPVALALDQEKRVTEQINALLKIARDEGDFASEQFMQWFIKEQVEEVATMTDLLAVATRCRDDLEDIEEYVAREQAGDRTDATAHRVAGA